MQTIRFPSKDGLEITANEYLAANAKGFMVLCHRSHFNRGEYRETAPAFNKLGFSCLAIDQRSGMQVLGVTNETYKRAKQKGLATGYEAAKPDIEAAVAHAFQANDNQPIILVGSSYSASLALIIAAEQPDFIKAVVAFSPGEYLKTTNVAQAITGLRVPAFVTSSKKESNDVAALLSGVQPAHLTFYVPSGAGDHGSRVLWQTCPDHAEYWQALTRFLQTL